MSATETIVDTTRRLEWKVSKEQFEGCPVGGQFRSPNFEVKIDSKISKWEIVMVDDPVKQNMGKNETKIFIYLALLPGDVSLNVEVEGFGIKTELDYKPGVPCQDINGKSLKMVSKIEHFNGKNQRYERTCGIYVGSKENTLKLFIKDKITVMATLRFYMDRNDYIKKIEREQKFVTHIRSISDLDSLADFTIICGDRVFKCHRNILASRSTIFKAMILNEQFVENRQKSVTIERASPVMVEAMLQFISNGIVPHNIGEKAIDLIDLADRYDLQDLLEICESTLADTLTVDSVIEKLIAIDLHIPNSQYRKKILDFIKKEGATIVKSSHWKNFVVKYPDLVTDIVLSLLPVQATSS